VDLTYRQVTLISVLVLGVAHGHQMPQAMSDIARFLQYAALYTTDQPVNITADDVAEAWAHVERWPVPPPGPPLRQPP
jgi:hypothetical protein